MELRMMEKGRLFISPRKVKKSWGVICGLEGGGGGYLGMKRSNEVMGTVSIRF